MKLTRRRVIICTVVFGGAILLYLLFPRAKEINLSYSQLIDALSNGQVQQVTIHESEGISGELVSGEKFKTELTNQFVQAEVARVMEEKKVPLSFKKSSSHIWPTILTAFLPILAVIILWLLLLYQMKNISSGRNKMVEPAGKSVTNREDLASFRDVAGYDQTKQELQEIIDFLRSPMAFEQLGAEVPRNILLVGPPGTGKTMLTQAIAQSANVPFFHLAGSEAVELFVGVGALRIRELFERAEKNERAIIFIDEIDAIARKRATALMHSNMEHDQTLNQLLVLLDGFIKAKHPRVIFFAATNREDVLDPAFLQRMNRRIVVNLPKQLEREFIIRKHAKGKPFIWDDEQIGDIAEQTAGFSGRELKNLINESARQSYHRLLRTADNGCPAGSETWRFFRPQNGSSVKSPVQFAGTCPRGADAVIKIGKIEIPVADDNEDGIWSALIGLNSPGPCKAEIKFNGKPSGAEVTFTLDQTNAAVEIADVQSALYRLGATIPKVSNPAVIVQELDKEVVGQDRPKHLLAAAAIVHYAHARQNLDEEQTKSFDSSVLLVGPTGVGKTHLARCLAKLLRTPFAIADAATLIQPQTVNAMKQMLLRKLLHAAGGNVQKAQYGIVCIQNLQRLVSRGTGTEGFLASQAQDMLVDFIKGETLEVSITEEAFLHRTTLLSTRGILFICEGTFPEIVQTRDLAKLGLSTDLISRFSATAVLNNLTEAELQTLLDPTREWSIISGYERLLNSQGIKLTFSLEGYRQIATEAISKKMGAKGIDLVMHNLCLYLIDQPKQSEGIVIDKTLITRALLSETKESYYSSDKSFVG